MQTVLDRASLDWRIESVAADAPHEDWHIATFVDAVLASPVPGVLVECGVYQGVSAAKWSHLADMLGRKLVLFDSFRGLPDNDEPHHRSIDNRPIFGLFRGGAYAGTLAEVADTVARFGRPEVVRYVEGWFADTLPSFTEPVAAAYLDVDLAASARTCLTHLWPLVTPGGCIVSQDGDFPLTVDAMQAWAESVTPTPVVTGLGESKMVVFRKAAQ
jgi:O-methyltransferase